MTVALVVDTLGRHNFSLLKLYRAIYSLEKALKHFCALLERKKKEGNKTRTEIDDSIIYISKVLLILPLWQ